MKVHFNEEFHLFIPSQVEAADELLKAARSSMNLVVHVSLESKNSLDLNTVRNNVKMVRF